MRPPAGSLFFAVEADGVVEVHAASGDGSYATLCGVDEDDPAIGLTPAELPKHPKITCSQCAIIIKTARRYRLSQIAESPRP